MKLYTECYTALPYGVKNTNDAQHISAESEPGGMGNNPYQGFMHPH